MHNVTLKLNNILPILEINFRKQYANFMGQTVQKKIKVAIVFFLRDPTKRLKTVQRTCTMYIATLSKKYPSVGLAKPGGNFHATLPENFI